MVPTGSACRRGGRRWPCSSCSRWPPAWPWPHLLPARLALWRLPAVASRRLARAGPVLGPVPARRRRAPPARRPLAAGCRPARPGRRAGRAARLGRARLARRRGGHRPGHRARCCSPAAAASALRARLHRQAGHRGGRARRARPGGPVHHPGGRRAPARGLGRPGRRRRPDPGRRARRRPSDYPQPATLASLAAADGAGAARPGRAHGPARLRHLAVHRAADWRRAGPAATSPPATSPRSPRSRWTRAG